jgi:SWI/SNF-related matrix-associated actin-dependent regulator of chromatin subfamily A-like protein 1
MAIELLPYQKEGAAMLASRRTGALLWEPGCRKTFTALSAAFRNPGRVLYLCPSSIRWQIADEARRLDPSLIVQVIASGAAEIDPASRMVVCSYDLAASKVMWAKLFKVSWGTMILDEAHYLKNRDAKRTRAVYGARLTSPGALYKKATQVYVLTGTPITNSPQDLWTHYSRLFPDSIRNDEGLPLRHREWIERFCLLRYTGFGEQIVGGKNLDELAGVIRQWGTVLKLEDVAADLPDLTVETVRLHGEQLSLRDCPPEVVAAVKAIAAKIEGGDEPTEFQPAIATLRARIALAKADAVASYVLDELAGGHGQVLVFGIHTEALQTIAAALHKASTPAGLIIGATPASTRQALLRDFQSGSTRVLIGNVTALGTGLNLQHCSRVVFAEASWSPHENRQALGRVYRPGQTRPVLASFVYLRGSIDDAVTAAVARKTKVIEKVLA